MHESRTYPPPGQTPVLTPLIGLFFLVSGFSALIYQVAWVRILSVSFGTTMYAVSTVLTIFMAGLALGSYLFGRWIDRWRRPLLVYGVLELALAVYVALLVAGMPWVQHLTAELLRGRDFSHTFTSLTRFSAAGLVLLVPTTLMGGTLPVLAKFVTRSSQTIGQSLGLLYGLNTLGAVFGSLAAAYVLILRLGVDGTILLAACLTGLVGLASCGLALFMAPAEKGDKPPEGVEQPGPEDLGRVVPSPASRISGSRLGLLYTIAFSSGFVVLAAEVLWTRLFINLLTANTLIFATILAAFLSGIACGSFLVSLWVDRLRSLDVAVFISVLASSVLLAASALSQGGLGRLFQGIRGLSSMQLSTKVDLSLACMFVLVAIPATVFGTVLPTLFRWCSRSLGTLGQDVGRLYAWNTLGSIAGAFVSGFLMVPTLGLNASLLVLCLLYSLVGALAVRRTAFVVVSSAVAAAAMTLIAIPSVRQPIFWFNGGFTRVTRIPPEQTLFLDEGIEGTVGVLRVGELQALTVNGVVVAETSLRDLWDLLLKAHLPMLLHEQPNRVALVGLGAGVSLGAVAAYEEPERIDTIEIVEEVVPAHWLFGSVNKRGWEDPRLKIWINDGRHFLLTTENRYDVISVDPTDPPVVYQYTQDFIQLCHDRLAEGGIMVQWVPLFHLSSEHLKVIMRAFMNVFPESSLWYDGTSILLMGRRGKPLVIDVRKAASRLRQPRVAASMAMIGSPDVWRLLSTYVGGARALELMVGRNVVENSDNRPYLEYSILRSTPVTQQTFGANLEMFEPYWESVVPLVRMEDRTLDNVSRLARENAIMRRLLRARIHRMRGEEHQWQVNMSTLVDDAGMSEEEVNSLWPFFM